MTPERLDELEPCPFCGSPAKIYGTNMVGCTEANKCGGNVDFGHWVGFADDGTPAVQFVIEQWNKGYAAARERDALLADANKREAETTDLLDDALVENERLRADLNRAEAVVAAQKRKLNATAPPPAAAIKTESGDE